jgi:hypothetical protein
MVTFTIVNENLKEYVMTINESLMDLLFFNMINIRYSDPNKFSVIYKGEKISLNKTIRNLNITNNSYINILKIS